MSRVAIVTGGTRGIGADISKALHNAGYKVAATYSSNDAAAQKFCGEHGIDAEKWDVGDYAACEAGIKRVEEKVGPVDILVNNAGITRDVFLHRMPNQAWDDVIRTNLTSCFNMCRVVITGMRERGFGRIVNVSSINAQAGQIGQVNYSAAKAGILGFTKALALESAPKGITVNTIAPGYVDTEMVQAVPEKVRDQIRAKIPVGRFGKPEEIADAVLYLVSDKAGFITGSTLTINGAQHLV